MNKWTRSLVRIRGIALVLTKFVYVNGSGSTLHDGCDKLATEHSNRDTQKKKIMTLTQCCKSKIKVTWKPGI